MPAPRGGRIEVLGDPDAPGERFREILTPEALDFLIALDGAFAGRRADLLAARRERRARLASGATTLDFLPETRWVRADPSWRVAGSEGAPGLVDRRVEITGPTERKMTVNALNSGARVWLADFEDATSPTWFNVIAGQLNLLDAIRGRLEFTTDAGKRYAVGPNPATIVVRPRGWHLDEAHLLVDGRPIPAALVDFGLYVFHCARLQIDAGSGPYFYLPKLEGHLEARLWNDVFVFAQDRLGIPTGTVRATVLIETIPAAFEMEEILYELREHCAGLNAGRWDYVFSIIKTLGVLDGRYVLPDRARVTMTVPFMRAYTGLLVSTCHRRGAYAIGGMAAFIPSRDPGVNARAFDQVRADKEREAGDGFDGSWVAHPGLVPVCEAAFDARLGTAPNQLGVTRSDVSVAASDLLDIASAGAVVTEAGLRNNITVALRYIDEWLRGTGAVAIFNLMEDAATAEIARCQVWQWLRHATPLDDGRPITRELVEGLLAEEFAAVRAERGDTPNRLDEAREVFVATALAEELPEFLTTIAYAEHLTRAPQALAAT
ncbi:malate synthase A [Frankia canadensis]|uniref:Malate synthase n=1 Tax=Frankia canadensis TaxID=1836972 RepID=A0A2I2KJ38_9ACTN|nr:malate synthase A [Frankia canadensis]SNQ45667.1 malate synthase A [Frankia canadensis]SOU52957.1 malate synthase A [Frankia canadensis]